MAANMVLDDALYHDLKGLLTTPGARSPHWNPSDVLDDLGNEFPVSALADNDAGRPFKDPRKEKAAKKPLVPTINDDPSPIFQVLLNLLCAFELHAEGLGIEKI